MTVESMSPERWQRVKRVAADAWARPAADRAQYVLQDCGGDGVLRVEVLSLLASMEEGGERFETPALAMPAGRVRSALASLLAGR